MKSHPAIKKSKLRETDSEALIQVAGSRIELETSGLWIRRSNQLSYLAVLRCKVSDNIEIGKIIS